MLHAAYTTSRFLYSFFLLIFSLSELFYYLRDSRELERDLEMEENFKESFRKSFERGPFPFISLFIYLFNYFETGIIEDPVYVF